MCSRDIEWENNLGDSQFSDGYGKVMYSDYLKTETDRLALASNECHLEKILKYHHAHFVGSNVNGGAKITPNLNGLKLDAPTKTHAAAKDVMPDSMEYNSIEEAWHEVEQKKKEIEILKLEHNDYAQCSENLYRKAEERIRDREDDLTEMWTHVDAQQSNHMERLSQRHTSNAANTNELAGMKHMVSTDINNPGTTFEKHKNTHSLPVNPPLYSQVAPMHKRGPSITSTLMVKQAGGTVDPQVEVKNPHKEQECVDWKYQFQTLGNAMVTQTNEVLLKTLNDHEKFQKRSKDLLDGEMTDLR